MGKKYSINSAGLIVAERDIYSLGGFIPKGKTGGKIANENQLSQDGECWFHTGDLSGTPNVVLRDNAFLFQFTSVLNNVNHFKLSGNTVINANLGTYTGDAVGNKPVYIHNSKINSVFTASYLGVSDPDKAMEQGAHDVNQPAGTPMSNMEIPNANACRTSFVTFINEKTRIVSIPSNILIRVVYTYIGLDGTDWFSGTYKNFSGVSIADLYHPVYKRCFIEAYDTKAMTPTQLRAMGIVLENQSVIRQVSLANRGFYKEGVITDSNIYINETISPQSLLVAIAGGFYNCKEVITTEGTSTDRNIMGTYHDIDKLIIEPKSILTGNITPGNDLYIRAYDCPLLHIHSDTYSGIPLTEKEGLVLRNCIVPKAVFINNPIEGNTYENIDFSYAQKDLYSHSGYLFASSHYQGMYNVHVSGLPYARIARVSGQHNLNVNNTILRPKRNRIGALADYDYTLIPHIEGSSYVVGGTSVYGDVKMVGAEYKYLVMGENMFERGGISGNIGDPYESTKYIPVVSRLRNCNLIPVKAEDRITCAAGYWMNVAAYDSNGCLLDISSATIGYTVNIGKCKYVSIVIKKSTYSTEHGNYISLADVPLAKVSIQYAYKKKYYVTNDSDIPNNELGGIDRNYTYLDSSKWEQGDVSNSEVNYGKTYEQIKSGSASPNYVRTKGLFNIPSTPNLSEKPITGFIRTKVLFDALERYEPNNAINAFMSLVLRKDPQEPITPSDVYNAHLVIEYVPTPRIIASYQGNTFTVEGKVRMYDNSVLYGNITNDSNHTIELHGDAVIGDNLTCVCSWGDE